MKLPSIKLGNLNDLVDKAIYENYHNVIILWGELGKGKTNLLMNMLYRLLGDWKKVVSFVLDPHTCTKCGHEWDAEQPYLYEVPCAKCDKEIRTVNVQQAREAVINRKLVVPFPFDLRTGLPKVFPEGTVFEIHSSPARGKITQAYPYMNFSFREIRGSLETAVETRVKLGAAGWDDLAVYFHRSNIQYMHPDVKNFFSRYNFIRPYVGNLIITVPTPNFVPEQLYLFCTADILITERGRGDFDLTKEIRSFWGKAKTWSKHYDGRDVGWQKVPDEWERAYEEIRHAHAVEAFEKPEEIFVTSMPQYKEFTEDESLF